MKVGLYFASSTPFSEDNRISHVTVFEDDTEADKWRDAQPMHCMVMGVDVFMRLMEKNGSEQAELPPHVPRVTAKFIAQVNINNGASVMDCDPWGIDTYDITCEIIALGKDAALALESDTYLSDPLRDALQAPLWVKDWGGPFRVEVPTPEAIDALFTALGAGE